MFENWSCKLLCAHPKLRPALRLKGVQYFLAFSVLCAVELLPECGNDARSVSSLDSHYFNAMICTLLHPLAHVPTADALT